MKRLMAIVLCLCCLLGLAACGAQSGDSGNDKKLVIWHDKEEAVVAAMQDYLREAVPDLEIVFEKKTSLTDSLKLVGNDPNAAPDLFVFAHDKIGVFAEMGILAPVTPLLPEGGTDDFLPMTVTAASYKGTLYQLPLYFETLLFMYNRRYMTDEDVPATTEELYRYMEENTGRGRYGFVEQHSTPYYAAGWINGFGGYLLNDQGEPGLNSPETEEALTYHKKFAELMPGETEYATVNTLFKEGMAHATIAGPWLIPTVRESGMDVGIAPMPVIDETGTPISPYMGVQGIQVLRNAAEKKPEAVEKVLRALMSDELLIDLAKASGCAPARESCYEQESITSDEVVMAMKETAESAVPMPNLPEMDVMWTVTGTLLTDVNMSGKDVAESADRAQEEALQLIENMK